ncbi:hypothetical protein Acr_09g0003470 [Actinidia rufa]|uniref:Uncharacterized protein n=1 Tax=Actinidia rufa TaxID=165716 RepID=A0A7J0F5J3_9ERIC|nr:hypothetical protein Acr_09g0003470 [Actinidia rufa]
MPDRGSYPGRKVIPVGYAPAKQVDTVVSGSLAAGWMFQKSKRSQGGGGTVRDLKGKWDLAIDRRDSRILRLLDSVAAAISDRTVSTPAKPLPNRGTMPLQRLQRGGRRWAEYYETKLINPAKAIKRTQRREKQSACLAMERARRRRLHERKQRAAGTASRFTCDGDSEERRQQAAVTASRSTCDGNGDRDSFTRLVRLTRRRRPEITYKLPSSLGSRFVSWDRASIAFPSEKRGIAFLGRSVCLADGSATKVQMHVEARGDDEADVWFHVAWASKRRDMPTARHVALVNQPPEASHVSIQLAERGTYLTSPIHLALLEARSLAWRTRIMSVQDAKMTIGIVSDMYSHLGMAYGLDSGYSSSLLGLRDDLSATASLAIVILILLLVVMIRISYIVIIASDLVTLRETCWRLHGRLLEDEVVVQALWGCGDSSRAHHSIVVEPPHSGYESMTLSTTEIELLRSVMSRLDTSAYASSSFAHLDNFFRSGNFESVSAFMSHFALPWIIDSGGSDHMVHQIFSHLTIGLPNLVPALF